MKMKKFSKFSILLIFLLVVGINTTFAETIFTYLDKAAKSDTRQDFHVELLKLALEQTEEKYGQYRLVRAPVMNAARSMISVKANRYPNFFVNESVTADKLNELGYVPFPIYRGLIGYRVFFVAPEVKNRLENIVTIEELKEFSIGQGIGWLASDILEHNGFKVVAGSNYEGFFRMLAVNRFDLFARGINEVIGEYDAYKNSINLVLDDSVAIYYPLPRYFFTHKSNKDAIKRITEGLLAAYEDGSFIRLWNKHHADSINRVDLSDRVIFTLENPFLQGVDKSYEKYMYKP